MVGRILGGVFVVTMAVGALFTGGSTPVSALSDCVFETNGSTMTLQGDCTTDATIVIPDGFTLDGDGHNITAVDPDGGSFLGAVVRNGGDEAHVYDLNVTADSLATACHASAPTDNRLRGILFEGASGSIRHSSVIGVTQAGSGCQEGNAIEVRNAPFDGTGTDPVEVLVQHNEVDAYMKGGIIVNGNVDAVVTHNTVGASANQEDLAANAVQVGFGAKALVQHNSIEGNQWLGASNFAATAVLLFDSHSETVVTKNNIGGNADVGIYLASVFAGVTVENNRVFDNGADGDHGDYGIYDAYENGVVSNNKVRGYETPYEIGDQGTNKAIPGGNN